MPLESKFLLAGWEFEIGDRSLGIYEINRNTACEIPFEGMEMQVVRSAKNSFLPWFLALLFLICSVALGVFSPALHTIFLKVFAHGLHRDLIANSYWFLIASIIFLLLTSSFFCYNLRKKEKIKIFLNNNKTSTNFEWTYEAHGKDSEVERFLEILSAKVQAWQNSGKH